jgi:hypothetical protein
MPTPGKNDPFFIIPEAVPYGTYPLDIKVSDKAGNHTYHTITLTVGDTIVQASNNQIQQVQTTNQTNQIQNQAIQENKENQETQETQETQENKENQEKKEIQPMQPKQEPSSFQPQGRILNENM